MAVTFTLKVQDVFAASVAPDKLTVPEPTVAVMVPPPQDPANPVGFATVIPAGKASIKFTVKSETVVLGFAMVKLRVDTPLADIVFGVNDFVMVGVSVAAKVFGARHSASPRKPEIDETRRSE